MDVACIVLAFVVAFFAQPSLEVKEKEVEGVAWIAFAGASAWFAWSLAIASALAAAVVFTRS